jgi:hypothetical protein
VSYTVREYAFDGKGSGFGVGVVSWCKVDDWRSENTG